MPMHFKHLSIQDGLSQNNVQSILQDSEGYMWFATESGLNRYDGYTITRYLKESASNPAGFANGLCLATCRGWRRKPLARDPGRRRGALESQ